MEYASVHGMEGPLTQQSEDLSQTLDTFESYDDSLFASQDNAFIEESQSLDDLLGDPMWEAHEAQLREAQQATLAAKKQKLSNCPTLPRKKVQRISPPSGQKQNIRTRRGLAGAELQPLPPVVQKAPKVQQPPLTKRSRLLTDQAGIVIPPTLKRPATLVRERGELWRQQHHQETPAAAAEPLVIDLTAAEEGANSGDSDEESEMAVSVVRD